MPLRSRRPANQIIYPRLYYWALPSEVTRLPAKLRLKGRTKKETKRSIASTGSDCDGGLVQGRDGETALSLCIAQNFGRQYVLRACLARWHVCFYQFSLGVYFHTCLISWSRVLLILSGTRKAIQSPTELVILAASHCHDSGPALLCNRS